MSPLIPECFYRISAKALVLDETREKFLLVQEQRALGTARRGFGSEKIGIFS